MRILQIYKDYPPVLGGIEGHLRDLAEGMAARGHDVTVLVASRGRSTRIERVSPRLTIARAGRLLHAASTPIAPAMLTIARAARPDVVHLHFPYPPGDLAALAAAAPLVVTYHSDIVRQRLLRQIYAPLMARTLGRALAIIATSPNYIASSPVLARYAAKCAVVPLGVDLTRFTPDPEPSVGHEPLKLLFVGRLRYYKGLHLLLDALTRLPGAILWLAGSGPEEGRLRRQAAGLGLGERVAFLGDVPDADLPALYRAADIFALPSQLRSEAFGIALLEALASGLPCVSTELGSGTSYINRHGETGLVVAPGDVGALADALRALAGDAAMRARMGAAARSRAASGFGVARMLDGVEEIYHTAGQVVHR